MDRREPKTQKQLSNSQASEIRIVVGSKSISHFVDRFRFLEEPIIPGTRTHVHSMRVRRATAPGSHDIPENKAASHALVSEPCGGRDREVHLVRRPNSAINAGRAASITSSCDAGHISMLIA